VTLLVQFRIALQVRQTIGAQFKITEKFVSTYTIWLGTPAPYRLILIWFEFFVDDQRIYLMIK